jgi:ABC-type phosphonate transport system ATPase subunit
MRTTDGAADSRQPLISIKNVSLSYGNFKALTDVSVDFFPGELVGLVGDNGAGKPWTWDWSASSKASEYAITYP